MGKTAEGRLLPVANDRMVFDAQIDRQAWAAFVAAHPQGNAFQTPAMYDFFLTVRNYRPLAVAGLDGQGRIQGVALVVVEREHRGLLGTFSSRAIAWGGPLLAAGADDAAWAGILAALKNKLGRAVVYLELRNLHDLSAKKEIFIAAGFAFREHLNFRVATAPPADPLKGLASNRKRQVKKGLASGALIEEARRLEQVEEFYAILAELYRNKVRKPLPDRSFFTNFFKAGDALGKYFLVTLAGKVIGGIMCPIHLDKAVYEWYVCGRDEQYPDQYPSVLATWAAIQYARDRGIACFDFMGAGAPDRDYGVREFKARFGGEMVNHGRFIRVNSRFLYSIGKLGLKLLGALKRA
jgi:serine/alanine adding enzyme